MGCNGYKNHNYSRINIEGHGDSNDVSMEDLRKAGNRSIDGLMFKNVIGKRGNR